MKKKEVGLTHSFSQNIIPNNIKQVTPVNAEKRNAVDIRKEVTCSLIEVKKERKSLIVSSDAPNVFDVQEKKKIKPKDSNQNAFDAPTSVHKTKKIKVKDTNQN